MKSRIFEKTFEDNSQTFFENVIFPIVHSSFQNRRPTSERAIPISYTLRQKPDCFNVSPVILVPCSFATSLPK